MINYIKTTLAVFTLVFVFGCGSDSKKETAVEQKSVDVTTTKQNADVTTSPTLQDMTTNTANDSSNDIDVNNFSSSKNDISTNPSTSDMKSQ